MSDNNNSVNAPDMSKKFLVVGVFKSKKGKLYATGRFWSYDKCQWQQSRNSDNSWGDAMIELSIQEYNKLLDKFKDGPIALIVDADIAGYNDYNFPIWSLNVK